MFIKREMRKGRLSVVMLFLITIFCSLSHASGVPEDIAVRSSQVTEKAESATGPRALQVRGDYNYPPYEYLDGHGKPQGFNVDIINAVADAMGLKVEIDLGPWDEVMLQLEKGKIDALMGMFNTAARDKRFDFSIPHFIASYAVFVRDGSPIRSLDDARNTKILVQLSDLGHDYLQENAITQDIIIRNDWSDVLTSLAKGEGDCAIVSRLQGTQLIRDFSISNIKAVGPPIIQRKYSIAVTQDNSALLAQINEGLSILKETGKYDQIYKKWFGIYTEQPLTFVKAFKYFFWIILPLIALAIAGFLWSWTLRRRVNLRTFDLNNELLEHRRTEEALRRRENQLRKIFEILPIGLWFADKDGNMQRGNPMGLQIWGVDPNIPISEYGPFKGCRLPSREPIEPDDWALVKTVREGVTITDELLEIESFDGKKKTILNYTAPVLDDNGTIDGAIVVNLDISDRMVLENQLLQSQKMESIGRLAGGVAHDFNNMLSVILGHSELLLNRLDSADPLFSALQSIHTAAARSSNLTRQLLAFARKQTVAPQILDLNPTLEGMLNMMRRLIGEGIDLTWLPGRDVGAVKMDPSQLDQILVNLCVNARDAIGDTGKVTIETDVAVFDEAYCAVYTSCIPGDYAVLAVSDNGCGIDPETLSHVFEPFFTTKEMGKGTGLGLATVYGIVKQNNGFINTYSEQGHGTTLKIYLPRTAESSGTYPEVINESVLLGHEIIILVEDEPMILDMVISMLERLGYTVIAASTPEGAIRLAGEYAGKIHLLITDVIMPKMNGSDLAAKLLASNPGLKTLFMSGYTANVIAQHGVLAEGVHFIQKPFSLMQLAEKVREALTAAV